MSEQYPPGGNRPPGQPEFSLSDLLPDLLNDPARPGTAARSPQTSAQSTSNWPQPATGQVPAYPPVDAPVRPEPASKPAKAKAKKSLNQNWGLVALVGLAVLVIPALIFGIFVIIGNLGSIPTPDQLAQAAKTPLPTVFSITPGATPRPGTSPKPGQPTTAPGQAAAPPTAAPCKPVPAQGPFDGYACGRQLDTGTWDGIFGLVDSQLVQAGVRPVGGQKHYIASSDSPEQILSFYGQALRGKGFGPSLPHLAGPTQLGNYSMDQYAKGSQQLQILVIKLTRDAPDGSAKAGESIVRFNNS